MVSTLTRSFSGWFSKWWRSRLPTREAVVVTAFLVLLFGIAPGSVTIIAKSSNETVINGFIWRCRCRPTAPVA